MSLLNKMLRDLDERRASDSERQGLPGDVRPLPPQQKGARWLPGLLVAAALLVAGAYWFMSRSAGIVAPQDASVPVPPAVSAPVVAPPVPATQVAPSAVADASPAAKLKLDVGLSANNALSLPPRSARIAPVTPEANATPPVVAAVTAAAPTSTRIDKRPAVENPLSQAESEFHRAQALLNQGQRGEAETALRQALLLSAYHAGARQTLFALLVEAQRKDDAQVLLEDGLQIAPAQSVWAMNLARLHLEKGNPAAAWDVLQRTLPYARQEGEFRAFCGSVLQRLNRPADAIEHFNAALRVNPGEGRWWISLALALEAAGHPAESREAYSRAKASGSLSPELAAFADQKSR